MSWMNKTRTHRNHNDMHFSCYCEQSACKMQPEKIRKLRYTRPQWTDQSLFTSDNTQPHNRQHTNIDNNEVTATQWRQSSPLSNSCPEISIFRPANETSRQAETLLIIRVELHNRRPDRLTGQSSQADNSPKHEIMQTTQRWARPSSQKLDIHLIVAICNATFHFWLHTDKTKQTR